MLIEDEPEEGYDDENTETQRTKTRVVGLSNAPSNFRFKVPVHSPFSTMPKKYNEYDLHGRRVVEEPTILDSVDVGHSDTGNNLGPDSDQYKPEDSTNSLAMNTLDLYKKNVESDPHNKLLHGGRKSVRAFYNPDYFALRRKGQGMLKASIIIPHQYIGDAGLCWSLRREYRCCRLQRRRWMQDVRDIKT